MTKPQYRRNRTRMRVRITTPIRAWSNDRLRNPLCDGSPTGAFETATDESFGIYIQA
jgi:hypothetical protein